MQLMSGDGFTHTEFANQRRLDRIGCPFAVDHISILLHVQTKDLIALKNISHRPCGLSVLDHGEANLAKLVQSALRPLDILGPLLDQAVALLEDLTMGLQPWV